MHKWILITNNLETNYLLSAQYAQVVFTNWLIWANLQIFSTFHSCFLDIVGVLKVSCLNMEHRSMMYFCFRNKFIICFNGMSVNFNLWRFCETTPWTQFAWLTNINSPLFFIWYFFSTLASPAEVRPPVVLPEIPEHATYLLIGAGTASFAALRAIRANDPKAKVSGLQMITFNLC